MDTDLETVIKDRNIILTTADIKSYMQMILRGLDTLHKHWVLHRVITFSILTNKDIKPNNTLISSKVFLIFFIQSPKGILKIADFGFAKQFGSPNPRFTHQIVTRFSYLYIKKALNIMKVVQSS